MRRKIASYILFFLFPFISVLINPSIAFAEQQAEADVSVLNESQSLLLNPYVYTPMEPDEWRQQLSYRAGEIGAQSSPAYPNSAAFITSVADSIGLCSVNIFKITDDISYLYSYLVLYKGMNTMPASILGDNENTNEQLSGDIIFFNGTDENEVYKNAGIIVDIDEQKVSVACVIDGITTIIGIKRDSFSQEDTIVHISYESSEKIIWDELNDVFPYYSEAARYGILANIFQESSYNTTAVGDNGMSYGLCQWYKERNVALVNYAVANNLTLDNIHTQLMYLKYELDTDERFASLANILSTTENNQFGAYNAGYYFCLIYENPADTISQSQYRGGIAQSTYSYYNPAYSENTVTQEANQRIEPEDKTPQLISLDSVFYPHGIEDLAIFLPASTCYDSILMDGAGLPFESYEISHGNMIRLVLYHEYMNSLPSGWHDISFVSQDQITTVAIRVQADMLSAEMARPGINPAATAVIITDAPAPRGALDISAAQDNGVVLWYDGTTCYISTQRQGVKVTAPVDCTYLFSSEDDELLLSNVNYMDVSNLDMSCCSDISYMFRGAGINTYEFSIIGLNFWDVSKVSNARFTFCETGFSAINWSIGSLDKWDTSSITDMTGMFKDAGHSALVWNIGDISHWDTSRCISMASMFEGCGYSASNFVLDLSYWDMSSMVSLKAMFKDTGYYSDVYSLNMAGWDLSYVRITSELFQNAGYSAHDWSLGTGMENWDVSNVTDMSYMFAGAGFSSISYSFDFGMWNVGNVENMESMFEYAGHNSKSFELLNLGNWNTHNVTDMSYMFAYSGFYSSDYSLDIQSWDVGNVISMKGMFSSAGYNSDSFLLNLSGWNTASVRDMSHMFENTGYSSVSYSLLGLETWDMRNVQTTESMFMAMAFETYNLELNLSNWNLSMDSNMRDMFRDMGAMSGVFALNLENWVINTDTEYEGCFSNTGNVFKYAPPKWYRR